MSTQEHLDGSVRADHVTDSTAGTHDVYETRTLRGAGQRTTGVRAGINNIKAGVTGMADAGKVITRLAPKQIKDEVQIAKHEMKDKGIAVGKGAAVAAGGAVFALLMSIALVILIFVGLAKLMPAWLAALVLVLVFLVLAAILGLVGFKMIKKQLPFKPESAIFGLLYDLGVLKEGSAMDSQRVKREMRQKEAEKDAKKKQKKQAEKNQNNNDGSSEAPAANEAQLKQRTKQRREHLKALRDDLNVYSNNIQNNATTVVRDSKHNVGRVPSRIAGAGSQLGSNASTKQNLQARWQPLAAFAASVTAFFVFLGKIIRK